MVIKWLVYWKPLHRICVLLQSNCRVGDNGKMDVQKITVTMLMLVALYLILRNADAFNQVISGVGNLYTSQIATLQGR